MHPRNWTLKTYLFAALFYFLVIVFSPKGLVDWALLFQDAERISQQNADLRREVEILRSETESYRSSSIAKERALRENLGYLQPDEYSLEIIGPSQREIVTRAR